MASLVMVHQQTNPSFSTLTSSVSNFSGVRWDSQIQWQKTPHPKVAAFRVNATTEKKLSRFLVKESHQIKAFAVPRKNAMALTLSGYIFSEFSFRNTGFAQQSVGFREYIDIFDGFSFKYPQNWIQVVVNIKSYANNNELAVMPGDRVVSLEWDRRYLSVLGVENNRLYELRLQTPENDFIEEENIFVKL